MGQEKSKEKARSDLRNEVKQARTGSVCLSSAEQVKWDKIRVTEKKQNSTRSDLRKKINQGRIGSVRLSSAEQVKWGKRRVIEKKQAVIATKNRLRKRSFMRERHESLTMPLLPTDVNPIIRLGWFHYGFTITFLTLAFFTKSFTTNDFDDIKKIVLCIFHVTAVAPWNLQMTIDHTNDPTNDPTSFPGHAKAILPSKSLWQATIDGDGTPNGNPGIPHLQRGGNWDFSK